MNLPKPVMRPLWWKQPQARVALGIGIALVIFIPMFLKMTSLFNSRSASPDHSVAPGPNPPVVSTPNPPSPTPPPQPVVPNPAVTTQIREALQSVQEMKAWLDQRYVPQENKQIDSTEIRDHVLARLREIDTKDCPMAFQQAFLDHIHAWEKYEEGEKDILDYTKNVTSTGSVVANGLRVLYNLFTQTPGSPLEDVKEGFQKLGERFIVDRDGVTNTRQTIEKIALENGVRN